MKFSVLIGFVSMVTVKTNKVNERIIMSKGHAIIRNYKRLDGSEVSYKTATSDIIKVVENGDEYPPAEITKLAGYKKSELQFLLPYLANQNVLKSCRTSLRHCRSMVIRDTQGFLQIRARVCGCLLYTSPSPRD